MNSQKYQPLNSSLRKIDLNLILVGGAITALYQNKIYSLFYCYYLISKMSELQKFMRQKQYKQDDYLQAVNDLTKLIKADPMDAQLYKLRADANKLLKEYNEAIADYSKAIEIDPKDDSAYFNRGIAYKRLNKYNEAIADYSKVIEIDPKEKVAYYNRGIAYVELNKYNEAIADYSKAIEIDPKLQVAYNNRGSSYRNLNKYNEAIADYSKAIEIDPKDQEAYYNRGIAYKRLNKYNEAIADYSKAIEIDPKDQKAYYNRGIAYKRFNKYNEAIADYSKAIEINPNYYEVYNNRGVAYENLKKYKQAQADYFKAIQISPNNPLYLLNLGNLYFTMSLKQKAEQYFLKSIDSFQRSTEKQLIQKYKLSEQNINFIKDTIQEFEKNKEQIAKLRKQAEKEHRNDLTKDLLNLDQINAEVGLLKVALCQLENKQNKQNKEKDQVQKLKYQLNEKLEQMQKQMKKMFIIQNMQKEQLQTLKNQNQAFKEQQKVNNQRLDSLEKMQQEVKKMSQKIFAVQNVQKKIENLSNSKLREYYKNLYNTIINHFLAYRVSSTGFFTQENKSLGTADDVLQKIFKAQPIIEKIPVIGDLFSFPFQIIGAYRQQKTSHINSIIAGKIMASKLNTESQITQFMAHVIQQLIKNKDFNEQLTTAIQKEQGSFIGKIQGFVTNKQSQLYSKIFGTNKQQFSYVNKVVVSHMTLLTLRLCEIDEEQFVDISKDKAQFYSMVIETISPDLKKKPQNAMKNQQIFSLNQENFPENFQENLLRPLCEKLLNEKPYEQEKGLWYYLCCQCLKRST